MSVSEILRVVGYTIPFLLHSLGINLLYKARGAELPNQRLLTLNLAVAESFYCLSGAVLNTKLLVEVSKSSTSYIVLNYFRAMFFLGIRFAMLHIIVDRFLEVWLNIKYAIYIHNGTLIKSICTLWILVILVSVAVGLFETYKLTNREKIHVVRLVIDIIILIAAGLTFTYLFIKVKSAVKGHATQQKRYQNRPPRIWFKLKIPILMVATFAIFNTSSSVLWLFRDDSGEARYYSYALVLDLCGWYSDAFIYVFLQRRVRRLLASSCVRTHRNQVEDFQIYRIPQSIHTSQC